MLKITQKNPQWLEKLKLRYKQEPLEAAVGFPSGKDGVGNAHYETGASIVEVAIWNNFGTEDIPPRPFMELASAQIQPKFKDMMREAVRDINSGKTTFRQALKKSAVMGVAEVRKAITDGPWEPNAGQKKDPETDNSGWNPNAPMTIADKKSKRPLIDSGDMRKFVTSDVRGRTK